MAPAGPAGHDVESVGKLLRGESGLRDVPFAGRVRNTLAAPAPDTASEPGIRLVNMAATTVRRAIAATGRQPDDPDIQLVLSTSLGAYLEDPSSRRSLSAWGSAVASMVGAIAPPIVISTACSSGADAIMVAAELVREPAAVAARGATGQWYSQLPNFGHHSSHRRCRGHRHHDANPAPDRSRLLPDSASPEFQPLPLAIVPGSRVRQTFEGVSTPTPGALSFRASQPITGVILRPVL